MSSHQAAQVLMAKQHSASNLWGPYGKACAQMRSVNSGVMLLSLERMRQMNWVAHVMATLRLMRMGVASRTCALLRNGTRTSLHFAAHRPRRPRLCDSTLPPRLR